MSALNQKPETVQQRAGENAEQTEARVKRQQQGRLLLRELRRLDLNFREYQLAELLLEMTYGWGLPSLIVPTLEVWCQLTGIKKPHVHTYLNQLAEIGIVVIEPTEAGPRYRVNATVAAWRCRLKVSRAAIKEALHTLKLHNGLDDPDFFEYSLPAQIPGHRVTESGTVTEGQL